MKGARGSAVERNLDAGPAGSGRAVARATSRGVGEAVIVEGDQSGPSRRGDLSRPDPPSEMFLSEGGIDPRKKSLTELGPPEFFFRPNPGRGRPQKFFFQTNMQQKLFRTMSGKIGVFRHRVFEGRERERACIFKAKILGRERDSNTWWYNRMH